MSLKDFPIDYLIRAMNRFHLKKTLREEEMELLQEAQYEVNERLGQPRGELHLTIIKGGKIKQPENFSVTSSEEVTGRFT